MELLPDAVLVVAPDLRGCGQSDKPEQGYDIAQLADDVWQFVSALGWTDFDLVGHATGGAVAIEFALQHMGVLHSLTLVDSVPVEGVYSPVETLTVLAQMRDDPALLSQALRTLMPGFRSQDDGDGARQTYFDLLVEDASKMAPAAFTEVAVAVSGWNRFEDASRLTLPTLLIWGDMDHIVDRDAITRTLIAVPGATNLEILHGVGHSPMIEAPLAFAELLIDFITDDFADYDEIRDMSPPPDDSPVTP